MKRYVIRKFHKGYPRDTWSPIFGTDSKQKALGIFCALDNGYYQLIDTTKNYCIAATC